MDRQSAVILSYSSGAFNQASKKLFTVNYLDCLSSGASQFILSLRSLHFSGVSCLGILEAKISEMFFLLFRFNF